VRPAGGGDLTGSFALAAVLEAQWRDELRPRKGEKSLI